MAAHLRRLGSAWGVALALAFLPALYWAWPSRVPFWYGLLVGAVNSIYLTVPAAILAGLVLFAARGKDDHGRRAAAYSAGAAATLMSAAMVYVRTRYG